MRRSLFYELPSVFIAAVLLFSPSGCFFAKEDDCGSAGSSQSDDDLSADRNPNSDDDDGTDDDATDDDATDDDTTDDDTTDDDAADDDATDDDTVVQPPIELRSTEFNEGGPIPLVYTCDNIGITGAPQWYSPPMYWLNPPEEVVAFALIFIGTDDDFVQWGLINIPADEVGLPAAVSPNGTLPGNSWEILNGDSDPEYTGPCPLTGAGVRNYVMTLYAMNAEIDQPVTAPADLAYVLPLVEEAAIEKASLTGTYERN